VAVNAVPINFNINNELTLLAWFFASLALKPPILMGWASELPVLVKMKNLTKDQQPHSDDPDFWDVWTRKYADGKLVERTVDWGAVVKEWQQK
jgi:hypothetical protein